MGITEYRPILVSACLIGEECRYNGGHCLNVKIMDLGLSNVFIPVCPEVLAGLRTPREPTEIRDERVVTKRGDDLTELYVLGARRVLEIAQTHGVLAAIMKNGSPSCGAGRVYDGRFTRTLIAGDGLTTRLLRQHGIRVISEVEV